MIERPEEKDHTATDAGGVLSGVRILVVMPTIPLWGMERKTLNIMGGLREQGADVLFITQKDHGQHIQKEVEKIGCRWVAASFDVLLTIPKTPRHAALMLRAWIKSAAELRRIRKVYKPTHIHIPNITLFLYSCPVLLYARETVVFALPTPPDNSFTGYKRHLNNFIWRNVVARLCDQIICNSKFTLSEVKRIGITDSKVGFIYPKPSDGKGNSEKMKTPKLKVIHNSVPVRHDAKDSAPTVVDGSKLNVAYVGRICPDKGVREFIDVALRVVSEREDVDFHLAGDYKWRNPFAEKLIEEVKSKGFDRRVRFHGEVSDVPGLLAQCNLHVCPSICEEAFGLVVVEAKSESLPSVVFPSGGLKETVNHLVDGYICPEKTSAALYEGVTYFLNRPQTMREAGRAAKRSLEPFSSEKISAAWYSVYSTPKSY